MEKYHPSNPPPNLFQYVFLNFPCFSKFFNCEKFRPDWTFYSTTTLLSIVFQTLYTAEEKERYRYGSDWSMICKQTKNYSSLSLTANLTVKNIFFSDSVLCKQNVSAILECFSYNWFFYILYAFLFVLWIQSAYLQIQFSTNWTIQLNPCVLLNPGKELFFGWKEWKA